MALLLSTIRPDWEDLVAQLQSVLTGEQSWSDVLTSSTGQTLIEFIAAVGAYDQYAIESAYQESFPRTAKNPSSIYAITHMLGVRLTRKGPAQVTVSMSAPSPVTIPAYSQFSGAGAFWFNRVALNITSSPQSVVLAQGQVQQILTSGLGTNFQMFVTPEQNFTVSDTDTIVTINGVPVRTTRAGLWQLKGIDGIQDETLADGRLAILFGNEIFGSRPEQTDVVGINYVVTSGADGNNIITLATSFTYGNDATVVATGTSNPTGGAAEPDFTVYKSVAAPVFGSFASSVTKAQYISLPFLYPGVVDVLTLAQREINPNALRRMNLIEVYLLTTSTWTQLQKDDFATWFNDRSMYSGKFSIIDPLPASNPVTIEVYCRNTAQLTQVQQNVTAAITSLFAKRAGVINRNIYRSDIISAARDADDSIEFCILRAPIYDLTVSRSPIGLPTVTPVAAGTLVTGQTYDYAIGYTSSLGGEVAPGFWRSQFLPLGSNQSMKIDWIGVATAVNYKIWGRQSSGTLGLIASVSSSTFTYTDNGSITPTPPLMQESTAGIYYNTLGTLTVLPFFTSRPRLTI